jgi:hypothetical protein
VRIPLHRRPQQEPFYPPLGNTNLNEDNLISVMSVYAAQFASYTTLLWQVPALGLTAQSFLLTIALGTDSARAPRLIASLLSALIAGASWALMHDQRGRAINYETLVRRLAASESLQLGQVLGTLDTKDGKPRQTDAVGVWAVDHTNYHVWRGLMILFAVADGVIVAVTLLNPSWAK